MEEALTYTAVAAEVPGANGLNGRPTFEHYVVRGDEDLSAVLIAARKDNCSSLSVLDNDINFDGGYRMRHHVKIAKTRMLTCEVGFKQNVGHLGRSVVVMGVHGHFLTMRIRWWKVWFAFWDRLADKIKQFGVKILAGDFHVSLTRVVPELRSRGLEVDCVAWYPWLHSTKRCVSSPFGFDSCGMFYIGGTVQVSPSYSLDHLVDLPTVLSAVAAPPSLPPPRLTAVAETLGLDTYEGQPPPRSILEVLQVSCTPGVGHR